MSDRATLTRKDFISDQDVRWCPGCGDYSILATVQKILPDIGVPKENIVMVSGIGCSSRFPFYVDTYGIHTLHGRAPTVASGIKVANPDLDVWLITGDGDGFSIGGNHMMHLLRRNLRIKVLLFNNRIYGLTKGQYSPTSLQGQKTKSSPHGSLDFPINPCSLAIGSEASFVARTSDVQIQHMEQVIREAAAHDGTAFVEILQNCVIFNDGTWEDVVGKNSRDDRQIHVEHDQPLVFGKEKDRAIRMKGFTPEVADVAGIDESELLRHDESCADPAYSFLLSRFGTDNPDFPIAMGVLRRISRGNYEHAIAEQIAETRAKSGEPILDDMYRGFGKVSTWDVAEKS